VKLLLDTHIMLWWALGNEQLSKTARTFISDERNECVVSVVSVWEIAIKCRLGRGLPADVTAHRYLQLIDEAGFLLKEVRKAHALGVEDVYCSPGGGSVLRSGRPISNAHTN